MLAPASPTSMRLELASQTHALLPNHSRKTIDFGQDGVAASLSSSGRFLSVHGPHPAHGMMVVVPYEQFPSDKFYEPTFVREYRARPLALLDTRQGGFGLSMRTSSASLTTYEDEVWHCINTEFVNLKTPRLTFQSGDGLVTASSLYIVIGSTIVQSLHLKLDDAANCSRAIDLTLDGLVSLNRASYAQLTEGGPLPMPPASTVARTKGHSLIIENEHLPARLDVSLSVDDDRVPVDVTSGWTSNAITSLDAVHQLVLTPGQSSVVQLTLTMSTTPHGTTDVNIPSPRSLSLQVQDTLLTQSGLSVHQLARIISRSTKPPTRNDLVLAYAIARNVEYLLGCCCVPIDQGRKGVCVITDHQCLPLGWNRDNFYQLELLTSVRSVLTELLSPTKIKLSGTDRDNDAHLIDNSVVVEWQNKIHQVLKGHLQWVYEVAQRPLGYWGRSYTTIGRSKDAIFQLDQQCYPLVELCRFVQDYVAVDQTSRVDGGYAHDDLLFVERILQSGAVDQVLDTIMSHRWEPVTVSTTTTDDDRDLLWLFKTEETPGDDAVAFPYHFSSHVLLWYALDQLANLPPRLAKFVRHDVKMMAEQVHKATIEHFVQTSPEQGLTMFAYLTSTTGEFEFYHDGNDLPTALAPVWGFCSFEHQENCKIDLMQVWRNTMTWAFSSNNKQGYFNEGQFHGLGSVHTKDPWPLGDAQQLLLSFLTNDDDDGDNVNHDRDDVATTKHKLATVVQWDGLWSEAIDRYSGQVTSKHWFSWPGSFIGSVLLSHVQAR
ncbi:hypothetical protein OIO90_006518 [Microbotryomycetes sp. JL221]|nr:hypothetical protein OIO90_006518 [Microbotryomycetes sp. JL221]